MKNRIVIATLVALLSFGCATFTSPAYSGEYQGDYGAAPYGPSASVDIGFFWNALAPYGSWVDIAAYGWVWLPRVGADWRPYTDGEWAYTDFGWTWVSDFDWGWAPFHYGRWYFDPEYGWVWVPGDVWGPAWVAWREGADVIGWAPLPPNVDFVAGVGFVGGRLDFDAVIPAQGWCFVDARYVTAPTVRRYVLSPSRATTYLRTTRNVTRYAMSGDRIVNRSLDPVRVSALTHRNVPRLVVRDVRGPGEMRGARLHGRTIVMYRPAVPHTRTPVRSPNRDRRLTVRRPSSDHPGGTGRYAPPRTETTLRFSRNTARPQHPVMTRSYRIVQRRGRVSAEPLVRRANSASSRPARSKATVRRSSAQTLRRHGTVYRRATPTYRTVHRVARSTTVRRSSTLTRRPANPKKKTGNPYLRRRPNPGR
jgi:Family of unknown function (DUF6600)